jgi:hypothetical protein
MRKEFAILVVAVLIVFGRVTGALAAPADQFTQSLKECGSTHGHRYEACAAYVFNDANGGLRFYYKYARSHSILSGLKSRFALKYTASAQATIRSWTSISPNIPISRWPTGANWVHFEVAIERARASLRCNRAVLNTRETWAVVSQSGNTLYSEQSQEHTVILNRVPDERFRLGSHVLHQWVVDNVAKERLNLPICP